jgi:hypothetical protein
MGLSEDIHDAGQAFASATGATLPSILNRLLERFLGVSFRATSASVVDQDGNRTTTFASVVYAAPEGAARPNQQSIPADATAAVIDVCTDLDLDNFRAGYARIAQAKRLKKGVVPRLDVPSTTTTLGIIFALRSALPLDNIAEELERLNTQTPGREWPDMVVVASTGAVHYAVQFPGETLSGDFLPPAEGALDNYTPPMYVVIVVRPTGAHTFNKMMAFLIGHLAIFLPEAKLPNWSQILEGVPRQALTISGFQYNLGGDLLPVPRQFHNDRYLPPLPMRIEDRRGNLLSTIEFLPWQDGGTILLRGKLPLEGLLIFLGLDKVALQRARVVRRPDLQISHVLPISKAHFNEMLMRFQRQSNMVVRPSQTKLVFQKLADEGSKSLFMARVFIGIMRLRDAVFPDPEKRQKFDELYEFVTSSLLSARTAAQEITQLWENHVREIASGDIARIEGEAIFIGKSIDKELRKQAESFLNAAVRTLKQGMQSLAAELHVDISFLFKKQGAFDAGAAALESGDPLLAKYMRQTRNWSEHLMRSRNAVEHEGWLLPRVTYSLTGGAIKVHQPSLSNQHVSEFIRFTFDRLICFVEELSAHCLQRQMPPGITVTEVPLAQRLAEAPERFRLTLANGGMPVWQIAFHGSSFEET